MFCSIPSQPEHSELGHSVTSVSSPWELVREEKRLAKRIPGTPSNGLARFRCVIPILPGDHRLKPAHCIQCPILGTMSPWGGRWPPVLLLGDSLPSRAIVDKSWCSEASGKKTHTHTRWRWYEFTKSGSRFSSAARKMNSYFCGAGPGALVPVRFLRTTRVDIERPTRVHRGRLDGIKQQ